MALVRAELERPHSPEGEPNAQQSLCRGMRPAPLSRLRSQIVARTRFFDEAVLMSIAAGVRQVVICGAGYDDRALRFRTTGVRFFELDHPATQAHKARQLRAMGARTAGLALVAADFRTADVAAVLSSSGHVPSEPSLFICEGLLVYLDQPTCTRLLTGLRSRAAGGSRLAASLAVHREGVSSEQVVAAANAQRRTAAATSPGARCSLSTPTLRSWGALAGTWSAPTDASELDADAAPGRAQFITAAPVPNWPDGQ